MSKFVHLHVHSQYSLLDGQAAIPAIVDKAMADGMPGVAITDHGVMYGIKEFINYVNKKNKPTQGAIKDAKKRLKELQGGAEPAEGESIEAVEAQIAELQAKVFTPIIGCEMYVAEGSMTDRSDKRDTGRHLIVLAKNKTGYRNLIKLVSKAWTKGFYFHPRTDHDEIAAHHEGLIICSACLGGEVPRLLARGQVEEAEKRVKWWKDLMGDDYYIELQRHKATVARANHEVYEIQKAIEPELIRLARKYDIKLIASNDSHFVNEEDAEAHDHLICISTKADLNDEKRMLYTKQEWFKTTDEMSKLFADMPEVIENTLEIIAKVETYSIDHGPIMPNYAIPEEFGTEEEYRQRLTHEDLFNEFTRDEKGNVVMSQADAEAKIEKLGGYEKLYRIKFEADYLRKLAYEGAEKRYPTPFTEEVTDRIDFELHIMKTMGFPGYFLIVQDFIRVGREKLGVSIGPGRGSAAGSVVAYCLGITQIDPLKYDLLFERFLNPDRISLPDIDVDFDDDGRGKVLKYVTEKYGEPNVAHIITYGTMAAKSAIKDVARVEQLSIPEANRLTKLIPAHMPMKNGKELKPTLANCYEYVAEFKPELESANPLIRTTLQYARALEGNVRNTGVHACGVIICRDDVSDWVPVSTADDKEEGKLLVTQYEGSVIEETGLIKMDFLGLKTLSIIKTAVANIKAHTGEDVDPETIDIEDPLTYKLYAAGRTIGTFQFESAGMQKYLRELQPTKFEDLIAMNALYRPGPMDYIPEFIARKHGRSPIVYDLPGMDRYLQDTYGVTVYQEQVMLLSRLLANFTRGESDTLRKAMGKKLIDKMQALKAKFLSGGQANGHDPKVLEKIWADWEKFASYAFNKSHATCYSWVAYQTAFLKANYPAEYMAAVLTRNMSDTTKLTGFMEECKKMHIPVKGPDVNESFVSFGVNSKGDIRFGLAAIKGVGESVVNEIIKARDEGGAFKSIYDFVERVPMTALNRRIFDSLALAGAFDCFGPDIRRETFFTTMPKGETFSEAIIRYGQLFQSDRQTQSMSLFGDDDAAMSTAGRPQIPVSTPWTDAYRLDQERDLVGLYLSAHPLDPYYMDLNFGCIPLRHFSDEDAVQTEGMPMSFGGMVVKFDKATTRKGEPFGRIKVEDFTGVHEFALFGRDYYTYAPYCEVGTKLLIRGSYGRRFNSPELRFNISSIQPLEDVRGKLCSGLTLRLAPEQLDDTLHGIIADAIRKGGQRTDTSTASDTATTAGTLTVKLLEPRSRRWLTLTSQQRIILSRQLTDTLKEMEVEYSVDTNPL